MSELLTIAGYLRKQGYSPPVEKTYEHIMGWLEWYQNEVKKFHNYTIFDGVVPRTEKRYRMGIAKKICEDWANLILNEKVTIKAGSYEERLNEILEKNNFHVRGNQLIELAFALGTGAFVEYVDGEDVIIDFVRADMIYPLSYDNNDVTECAFGSYRSYKGKECIYLQIHRFGNKEDGENENLYYIENRYVDREGGGELELPENMEGYIPTGSEAPLFQILTPNMVNNIDLDSPMGISVFANAVDEMKACDLVFDSYVNEFILGRKRVIVPMSMAKMVIMQEGGEQGKKDRVLSGPEFDPSETVFYQMPADRNSDLKPTEIDMKIRAQEHELGIQRALDLCSFKCGMGTGRYRFESSGVKTATEVISDKSDLYQNLKKNEIPIKAAVIGMVKAVAFLDGKKTVDPTVNFDDSIIEDSNSIIDKNIKLVNGGLRSKLTAIMEIEKCEEADAQKELERIQEESQITADHIDWTAMEGEEDEQKPKDGGAKEEKEKTEKTDDSKRTPKADTDDKR